MKDLFAAATALEILIENLPEVDEIEEKLERLKESNRKELDDKNQDVAVKDSEVKVK